MFSINKLKRLSPYYYHFFVGCLLLCLSLPAAALTDMQGKPKKFSDFIGKGKWTVFEVWSSQCPACPDAVFYMNNLKRRYNKAQLIGISVNGDYGAEGPKLAAQFIKQQTSGCYGTTQQ